MQDEPRRADILLAQDRASSRSERNERYCLLFEASYNGVDIRLIVRIEVMNSVRIVRGGGVSRCAARHFGFCNVISLDACVTWTGGFIWVHRFPVSLPQKFDVELPSILLECTQVIVEVFLSLLEFSVVVWAWSADFLIEFEFRLKWIGLLA